LLLWDGQYFAVGQRLLILGGPGGTGGSSAAGECDIVGPPVLDLSRYPNAAADMTMLRAFTTDRAIYDQLIAAQVVADAIVIFAGPRRPVDPISSSTYQADLTLQIGRTLCGEATTRVTARYFGNFDQGVQNPAGAVPPTAGAELIVLLAPSTLGPPASHDLLRTFVPDSTSPLREQWSRFSALLSSPPSLSL
jgi:hypothetical protein